MLDFQIFQLINNLAGQNAVVDNFFIFITLIGNILLFCIILFTRNKELILKSVIAYVLVRAIDFAINLFYYRPRPFIIEEVNLLIAQLPTASFPSRHAMTAFSFAQLFYFWNKKYSVTIFMLASLVALSRIYVGVHYPLDVIAGIVLGIGIAFLIEYSFGKYNLLEKLEGSWKFLRSKLKILS